MESVKKEGDSVKKGKCDNKKPYIQFYFLILIPKF